MEHDEGKHGEPWNYPVCIESQSVLEDRTGRVIAEFEDLEKANRAGVCVNACADMEDPEKEIARLREIEAVVRDWFDGMETQTFYSRVTVTEDPKITRIKAALEK